MIKPPESRDLEQDPQYSVGYRKPPVHSRFTSGQSGNPKGRPRTARNRITILDKTLNERVIVTNNGRRKIITKQEAIYKQLVNKAATGDPRAAQLLFSEMREIEARIGSTPTGREIIDEIDQEVFQNFLKRLDKNGSDNGDNNDSNSG
jgi:Family of unknown function (DUF5681)